MPPKQKFSRQEIVEAALRLTREKGIAAVTARDLGATLGISSRPVYTAFSNMAELKGEVYTAAAECFEAYCHEKMQNSPYPKYKALGLAYVGFAREECELFKLLFMSDREEIPRAKEKNPGFSEGVSLVREQTGIDTKAAERFHSEIWIFVHGIATMIATATLDWEEETVSSMMTDVYKALAARQEQED